MKTSGLFFTFIILSLSIFKVNAKDNDTIHIVSHNKTLMVTDPSRGVNEVINWVTFPSEKVPYRKITAHLTLQCPDGMKCGAWDYLDYVIVKRQGGIKSPVQEREIVRNLTPYGSWFGNEWKFTWTQDITDWGCLLRDSVEIEYRHTGYEDNKKMGWLVTVDFEIITGKPVMKPLGYDSLWYGSFAYGDTLKPFETLVKPRTLDVPAEAKKINLHVIQTGHGMDKPDNCSEFCPKWRELYVDGQLVNKRSMTITCGTNPLYPQSGTWIYDRSNWCPGSLAIPDIFTIPVINRQHTFDLKMEPYISTKPSGGWSISAYAFYYKEPSSQNDVSLEEIISPSTTDYYNRINPIGFSPKILVKNNGSNDLESLKIEYGLKGRKKQVYYWTGNIPFPETKEIVLPGIVDVINEQEDFEVKIFNPNKKKDEYPYDNTRVSIAKKLPVYGDSLIVSFLTNNITDDTGWQIKDSQGNIVFQRTPADSLKQETLYNDTISLPEGYYEFLVNDKSDNGLYYWANPRAGYGYIRLLNNKGNIIQDFNSDFGTFIHHAFKVGKRVETQYSIADTYYVTSHSTKSLLGLDIILNKRQNILVVISDMEANIMSEHKIHNFLSGILQIDVSMLKPGLYDVSLKTEDGKIIKKTIKKVY